MGIVARRYKTEEKHFPNLAPKHHTGWHESMPLEDVFAKLAIKSPKRSFVGAGHNAAVRILPNGTLLKTGKIGLWEAPAMIAAQGIPGIPEIYSYSQNTIHCEGAFGTSLKYLLKKRKFSEQDRRYMVSDLICLLRDLHCRNISHNDLHSGNVFWCPGLMQVHLIDFGYAKMTAQAACLEALSFLFSDKTPDGDTSIFQVLKPRETGRIENILRNNLLRIGVTEETYLDGIVRDSLVGFIKDKSKRQGIVENIYKVSECDYETMIEAIYDGIPRSL